MKIIRDIIAGLAIGALIGMTLVAMKANAADLGMKDTPTRQVTTDCNCADTINWAGLSIGIQAGIVDANHDVSVSEVGEGEPFSLFGLNGISSTGFLGRVTAGYDFQFDKIVVGVRGFYGLSNAETTLSAGDGFIHAKLERDEDYGGIVRLGRVLGSEQRTLLFVTVGWQHGSYSLSASAGGSPVKLSDAIDTNPAFDGPTAGIGLDYAITKNAFIGLEYSHWFSGEQDLSKMKGLAIKDNLSENTVFVPFRWKF
jgi:outer membrane immunogenic protein